MTASANERLPANWLDRDVTPAGDAEVRRRAQSQSTIGRYRLAEALEARERASADEAASRDSYQKRQG